MVNLNKQLQIRTQLQNKVFSQFGKTVTLYKQGTPVYNSRGEITDNDFTTEQVTLVNYNITNERKAIEKWGSWNPGDMEAIIPYDVDVSVNDELEVNGKRYYIVEVRVPELPGELVNIVRLALKDD